MSTQVNSDSAFLKTYPSFWRGWRRALILLGLSSSLLLECRAQNTLANGGLQSGSISAGGSQSWTFSAAAGAAIMVRVGTTNVAPKIELFDAGNASIGQASAVNGNFRDVFLTAKATGAGTYTVVVSGLLASQTGTYGISLAEGPGTISIAPGDEGGALASGALNVGTIALGDLDVWSFSANAGDALMLRAGGTNFTPWIRLYSPSGALVEEATSVNGNFRDSFLNAQAPDTGTYTVVLSAAFPNQFGPYGLTLAQAPADITVSPGDEGGPLKNGFLSVGNLPMGDIDVWSFSAQAGDQLMLRAGATNVTPWIRLYGPNGALVDEATSSNGNFRDTFLTNSAAATGTYTVFVSAAFANQQGSYGLTLVQAPGAIETAPGDEGGTLANGAVTGGELPLGDIDLWSLTAKSGDQLLLRAGATNFTPWIRVYGPNGALVGEGTSANGNFRDTAVSLQAASPGNYTVALSAAFANQAGSYGLTLDQIPGTFTTLPGDTGGVLTNGVLNTGAIPLGDQDVWTFSAQAGDGIMLRMGATNFTNWIRLYGPDGSQVAEATSNNGNFRDSVLTAQALVSGTYTVLASTAFLNQAGTYGLTLVQVPAPIFVSPGDEGGALVNGVTNAAVLSLGDLDVWSFYGTPGDSNNLRVVAVSFTPWIRLYGPDGTFLQDAKSANGNVRDQTLSQVITNAGTYTVVVSAAFENQAGSYTFKQSRVPPDLNVPPTQTLDEGASLEVSISAQDPDQPVKPLVFNVLSGPPAMTLKLAGATNATLSWATTEADGPSTNLVVVTVTDTVNGQAFIRTNSFTVIVNELNTAPKLTVPANQTLNEGAPLNLSASATDVDLPPNPLTYSLVSPPAGMTIDPNTGAISWTPSEDQGPSSNLITVVVTDSSPSAVNAKQLSDTNTFTVVVNEVNTPPHLTVPSDQHATESLPFSALATATDADLPANPLTFALVNPPAGMTIDPNTGAISWVPTEAQGPSTNLVTVTVTDSNPAAPINQHLTATGSFTVIVDEVNTAPQLTVPADQVLNGLVPLQVTASATDSDLPANALTFSLLSPPAGMNIDATTGAISWTPTAAQAPSTNRISVVVTDFNPAAVNEQHLSVTNSFTVVVRANTAPVLQAITDQSVHFGNPLTVQVVGSDSDNPAQVLTYSLDQAPTNMTINASTGLISWTPTESQIGSTPVTVRVTDNGVPPMSASLSFKVTVSGAEWSLALQPLAGGLMQITIIGDTTFSYEIQKSEDLTTWEKLVQQSGPKFIDPDSTTTPIRFYRLKLLQP